MSDLIKTLKSSETGNDVYPNIKPDNIPSDAITSAKISDGAVTTDKLADTSVTTAKIEDEGVTTAKIGALAVTTAKIDTGAVTSNKLAESSVTGTKINDGAVSYNKLASALRNLIDGKASQSDLETLQTAVQGKQDALVSGTNIKTINNQSVLGSGNIDLPSPDVTASGNNTFTGENTFNDTTNFDFDVVFNNGAHVKDDVYFTDFSIIENEDTGKDLQETLDDKQDTLIDSGANQNIKTINNQSLLGSGNINISGGGNLYKHTLSVYIDDESENGHIVQVQVIIYNTSNTPITSFSQISGKIPCVNYIDDNNFYNNVPCFWYMINFPGDNTSCKIYGNSNNSVTYWEAIFADIYASEITDIVTQIL